MCFIMAAPVKKMAGVSDDSSSSDDEVLKRCQEAVWETKAVKSKDADASVKESKRLVVADHEHDGNELQVTPGFQTHVARKLGHFLDSCISEIKPQTSSCLEPAKCNKDDEEEEEGFRLFSTSVPGKKAEDPPAPVRRRPAPSSSDSDDEMEMRLKEAAVSVKDLLPSLVLSPPSMESPCSVKMTKTKKKDTEGEESRVKKKKKKKKKNQEDGEQVDSDSTPDAQSNGELTNSEQEHMQVKVKRKKKKKRQEENAEEEALH
ncbi:protein CUSTOS [Astatotilapia calliptera]|uniref:Protein CUSTOS n=1 Tax=Astatotilapia calliptera TaxID=8154 RepID=A0AAX7TDC2_ASTCA|nr:protein CUSTOS [Astatotilapia calliptera]